MGGTACGLCRGQLPGNQSRQYVERIRSVHQQAGHGGDPVFRRQAGHRRRAHGRRIGRLQPAGRPVSAPGAAACADCGRIFIKRGSRSQRLGDILNTPAEPAYNPGRAALPAIRGDVTFEHVTFRYRIDGPEVLHDVNFSVAAGQVVGIVGPSGSGKSTLAKLLQRLYVPESGRVLVDGVDLAQVDPTWLRRQIGVVLQENVLFNRSIRDNIALSDPGMSTRARHHCSKARPARTTLFSSCRKAMTRLSVSGAQASPEANVSASQSLARW